MLSPEASSASSSGSPGNRPWCPFTTFRWAAADRKDDKVIETALNANADVIVSGDRDLYEPRAVYGVGIRRRPIRVVGVRTFLAELRFGPWFSPLLLAAS